MAWIRVIPAESASGDLRTAYEEMNVTGGPLSTPFEVMTNNGPALLGLERFDHTVRFGQKAISRLQTELIATYVSALNGCVF